MILLPESNLNEAVAVADKLIGRLAAVDEAAPPSAASIGVAAIVGPTTGEDLLGAADRALYVAKRAGGNTFRIAHQRAAEPPHGRSRSGRLAARR